MVLMYSAICLLAIVGNGLVCFVVYSIRRMRTVTNYFIVNLAIGDILMTCLCIPFTFVSSFLLSFWPFGQVMCTIVTYAQAVSVFISAYTLVAISIDRYIAVIHPLRPKMVKIQAKCIIACIWLVALLTPLPTAVTSTLIVPDLYQNESAAYAYVCVEKFSDPSIAPLYSMALLVLQYFFPLIVLIFTYTRIAMVVWGKTTPGEAEDARDKRLAASKRKVCKSI